jgi:IclR family acetate operon transcriptional repressor
MSVQTLDHAADAPVRLPKPRRADGDLVQSLVRALNLLEILSDQACRLTELAHRAQLPPSTTHRLLTTLEQKRFVRFDREENLWSVGSHCYAIGSGFLRGETLLTRAVPLLNKLASQLGAVANLGVLEGGKLILVWQSVGCHAAPVQPPGASLPLHATAMGKALLAGNDSLAHVRDYVAGQLTRHTAQTICDPQELARELRGVRMQGIALDNEESLVGRRCVAAPVYDDLGHCIAAISITATQAQMTDSTLACISATVTATADKITRAANGRGVL